MKIAIVGGGPRGLFALENLFTSAARNLSSDYPICTLFEESLWLGAGPVYSSKQPDTNWLNISSRLLKLEPRKSIIINDNEIQGFPSFHEWSKRKGPRPSESSQRENPRHEADHYPSRSYLGNYLIERFNSLAISLEHINLLKVIRGRVVRINPIGKHYSVEYSFGSQGKSSAFSPPDRESDGLTSMGYDEVLLTIGHQTVQFDPQIQGWLKSLTTDKSKPRLFTSAYPVHSYVTLPDMHTKRVAVRGFGLAMIDTMRALTIGLGGTFETQCPKTLSMIYRASGKEPATIVPFSLDGLPLSPKPRDESIDSWYEHDIINEDQLLPELNRLIKSGGDVFKNLQRLAALNAATVFMALDTKAVEHSLTMQGVEELSLTWIKGANVNDQIFENEKNVTKLIENFVGMASSTKPVSLDYCIGQVWRKMQPTMYQAFSLAPVDDEIMTKIITLDDRLKRYAFGPPLASMQQLLALTKVGLINLDFVNNPDIQLDSSSGWTLENQKSTITTEFMINSVLAAPDIRDVNSPIIVNLLNDLKIGSVYEDLGLKTDDASLILTSNGSLPVAVLGRLAKGALFGVDAILECFGDPPKNWAKKVIDRMMDKQLS